MKRIYRRLEALSASVAVAGFLGMISVNADATNWLYVLLIAFLLFATGIAGAAIFERMYFASCVKRSKSRKV